MMERSISSFYSCRRSVGFFMLIKLSNLFWHFSAIKMWFHLLANSVSQFIELLERKQYLDWFSPHGVRLGSWHTWNYNVKCVCMCVCACACVCVSPPRSSLATHTHTYRHTDWCPPHGEWHSSPELCHVCENKPPYHSDDIQRSTDHTHTHTHTQSNKTNDTN